MSCVWDAPRYSRAIVKRAAVFLSIFPWSPPHTRHSQVICSGRASSEALPSRASVGAIGAHWPRGHNGQGVLLGLLPEQQCVLAKGGSLLLVLSGP